MKYLCYSCQNYENISKFVKVKRRLFSGHGVYKPIRKIDLSLSMIIGPIGPLYSPQHAVKLRAKNLFNKPIPNTVLYFQEMLLVFTITARFA